MQQSQFRYYKLAFLLPGLFALLAVILFPLGFTIWVSLTDWNVVVPSLAYSGFGNYVDVLMDDRFWRSFKHLAIMAVGTVLIQYVLGFAMALLVWREIRFRRFFRVLFLVPMMTTPVIMTIIWRTIFHQSLGPMNDLLGVFGLGPYPWLTEPAFAFASVMIVEVWQWTPFMFLLLLAGLLSLPREPIRAAEIDGAGPIRTFFNVTFPLMAPISVGAIIIRLIEASKIMESVYVLTAGGPGGATETAGYYIYIRGLQNFQIGYAAALSVVYLVIMIAALTIISKLLVKFFVGERA